MPQSIITTESEYQAALSRAQAIFEAKPNTPEGIELDVLITQIETYESQWFPDATTPRR